MTLGIYEIVDTPSWEVYDSIKLPDKLYPQNSPNSNFPTVCQSIWGVIGPKISNHLALRAVITNMFEYNLRTEFITKYGFSMYHRSHIAISMFWDAGGIENELVVVVRNGQARFTLLGNEGSEIVSN